MHTMDLTETPGREASDDVAPPGFADQATARSVDAIERADLLLHCRSAATVAVGVARLSQRTAQGLWKRNDRGDELLLVTIGRVRIHLVLPDGREQEVAAAEGDLVRIPMGAAHAFTVPGGEVRFVYFTPREREGDWNAT